MAPAESANTTTAVTTTAARASRVGAACRRRRGGLLRTAVSNAPLQRQPDVADACTRCLGSFSGSV